MEIQLSLSSTCQQALQAASLAGWHCSAASSPDMRLLWKASSHAQARRAAVNPHKPTKSDVSRQLRLCNACSQDIPTCYNLSHPVQKLVMYIIHRCALCLCRQKCVRVKLAAATCRRLATALWQPLRHSAAKALRGSHCVLADVRPSEHSPGQERHRQQGPAPGTHVGVRETRLPAHATAKSL